jgi:16S rRNA (guanine527-N7)-methyltransferase
MNPLWHELADRAKMTLTEDQHAKLSRYLDLLLQANKRMNLTRIVSRQSAESAHVGDALTLLPFIPKDAHRIVDIGSGGGVPGLVLAIVRSDLHVTMVEATQKKARFLDETAAALGLINVAVVDERAEQVGRSQLRETFDVATARAVGELVWLAEWCLPLVKKGGCLLAMKGRKITEELPAAKKAIKLLGGAEPTIHPVELPGTEHHVIVKVKKLAKTDLRYPRPATSAKGRALG